MTKRPLLTFLALLCWSIDAFHVANPPRTTTHRRPSALSTVLSATSAPSLVWKYKGHDVYTVPPETSTTTTKQQQNQQKPAVVLIHGFGCSTTYWRRTRAALTAAGYDQVHALDLLGQGKSSKPGRDQGIEYSIRLWADQVDQYIQQNIDKDTPVLLCGNSLGSLVALTVATRDHVLSSSTTTTDLLQDESNSFPYNVQGICMFNCGVGLNSKGIAKEDKWNPLQSKLIEAVYTIFEWLIFRNIALLTYVLEQVVTPDLLSETLQSLYKHSPEHVDDELVQSFYQPAQDEGSVQALSQIYTNDPGVTPMDLHRTYTGQMQSLPIHLIWGDNDAVTPLEGGVGQFYYQMGQDPELPVTFDVVSSGHVPFDDNPEASHHSMLEWMQQLS